eukprot:TRINITY_DN11373_c0_g1_i3.p1 TRINITY_DN11373_c0_g1~~TRINITY_DN11373_c0_g1_i3.p1  ORF type:complete len:377 (+),score=66.65 TRINITY_DN11373_c0_g1_i3:34-1164(+)
MATSQLLGPLLVLSALLSELGAVEVPLYCGTVVSALRLVDQQHLVKNLGISVNYPVPVVGDVLLTLDHVEFGKVSVASCDASVANATLGITLPYISLEVRSFRFSYKQERWPHEANSAHATGNLSFKLDVSVNVSNDEEEQLNFHMNSLNLHVDSTAHKWLYDAAIWLGNHAQGVLGVAIQHELRGHLQSALQLIRQRGACAEANSLLRVADTFHLEVKSVSPAKVHVPMLGDVEIFLNVSNISLPGSMQCAIRPFNGTLLDVAFNNLVFSLDFDWRYMKAGQPSSYWQNAGWGHMNSTGGCYVNLDFLQPGEALDAVLRPLVRKSIETFGGHFVKRELECLADPACYNKERTGATVIWTEEDARALPSSVAAFVI